MSSNGKTAFNISPVAQSIPFNNESNDFVSQNIQEATEEAVFKIKNTVFVNKQHSPGHFLTIKDALDSITDSSMSNPYVIIVGPGVYIEDNSSAPITLKPAVTLMAEGHSTVIVEPSNPNENLFLVDESNCRIQGMTLRNVTGASAIKVTSSPTPVIVDFITISNCLIPVYIQSDSTATQAVFRNLRLISGSTTTNLMKIEALDGEDCIVRIYSAILTDDNGTDFESGIFVTGLGSRIDPNTVLVRSTVGVGNGFNIDDGGHIELTSGCEIHGFNDNIIFNDSGVAPTAKIQGMTSHHGITSDLNVIHPSSVGSFSGIIRRAFTFNAAPTTFLLVYMDPVNGNFNNTGMIITRGLSPELNNITTDGTTHTLTRFDAHTIILLGSTAGTVIKLPDALTFLKTGHLYNIWNFSSVIVEIQDFSGNLLAELRPNGQTLVVLRDISTSAGIWGVTYTIDSGNVFGTELHFVEADAETSTNSTTTYLNKLTLVTPSLPLGDYLVQFQFNWRAANADRQIEVRVQRGGADIELWEPFTSSTADRQLLSGFVRQQNISGVQTLTLDFRVGGSGTTVFMSKARLFIWRIG